MLRVLGYQVFIAEDGQEAINVLKSNETAFDVILMDQSMPRKDGVTATREIRELEATNVLAKRHLIIAATAVVNSESEAAFKEAGADDFLSKPLSLYKLRHTLFKYFPMA